MLSYEGVRRNERQFLSMTGMEAAVFDELPIAYQKQWGQYIKAFTI